VNHFVPSSIHLALAAAGLRAVSLRQDLFRGAHVVVAEAGLSLAQAEVETAPALGLLAQWNHIFANIDELARLDGRVAIYGAGFYGALFAPRLGAGLVAFLDRNPHLRGGKMDNRPILPPEACPPVEYVLAALNPARARAILPPDAPWLPSGARVVYPGEAA